MANAPGRSRSPGRAPAWSGQSPLGGVNTESTVDWICNAAAVSSTANCWIRQSIAALITLNVVFRVSRFTVLFSRVFNCCSSVMPGFYRSFHA